MSQRYCCSNLRRRNLIDQDLLLNGLDYLEVCDIGVPDDAFRQRLLLVRCLKTLSPAQWSAGNVAITGGVRVPDIEVSFAAVL